MMDGEDAFEVVVGSHAVWVNSADGHCIGRFGRNGVDVHHALEDALAGGPQCLACTHRRTTLEDWHWFRELMFLHHAVAVPADALPSFLKSGGESFGDRKPVKPDLDSAVTR